MADLEASAPAATPGLGVPVARSPITPAQPVTIVDGWEVSAIRADDANLTLTDCTPLAKVAVASRQAELNTVRFGRTARDEDGTLVVGAGPRAMRQIGPPPPPPPRKGRKGRIRQHLRRPHPRPRPPPPDRRTRPPRPGQAVRHRPR